jgi:hypothetical protein
VRFDRPWLPGCSGRCEKKDKAKPAQIVKGNVPSSSVRPLLTGDAAELQGPGPKLRLFKMT